MVRAPLSRSAADSRAPSSAALGLISFLSNTRVSLVIFFCSEARRADAVRTVDVTGAFPVGGHRGGADGGHARGRAAAPLLAARAAQRTPRHARDPERPRVLLAARAGTSRPPPGNSRPPPTAPPAAPPATPSPHLPPTSHPSHTFSRLHAQVADGGAEWPWPLVFAPLVGTALVSALLLLASPLLLPIGQRYSAGARSPEPQPEPQAASTQSTPRRAA